MKNILLVFALGLCASFQIQATKSYFIKPVLTTLGSSALLATYYTYTKKAVQPQTQLAQEKEIAQEQKQLPILKQNKRNITRPYVIKL